MRTCFISSLPFGAAIFLLISCSVNQEPLDSHSSEVSLIATTECDFETRTTLDKDYSTVLWMPEESISVFSGDKMAKFTSDNSEKAQSANFRGILPDNGGGSQILYGLYPYNADATISKDVITTTLPSEQEGFAESFANELFISVSKTSSDEMMFRNVCSGLRFMLDRNDIQTVTFLSNGGEPLAGDVSVFIDKSGDPAVKEVAKAVSEVKLSAPFGKTFESGV